MIYGLPFMWRVYSAVHECDTHSVRGRAKTPGNAYRIPDKVHHHGRRQIHRALSAHCVVANGSMRHGARLRRPLDKQPTFSPSCYASAPSSSSSPSHSSRYDRTWLHALRPGHIFCRRCAAGWAPPTLTTSPNARALSREGMFSKHCPKSSRAVVSVT